ncbi:MAG: class I SAM-dependent methyltransferase [Planctomycetes bacterium]|jgi:predicted O-methyltransferase YrrM|nr:class I SAM-dependent methyltransferase [Planctomycetota bacterium]
MSKKPLRLGTRARLLLRGLRYAPLLPFASIDGWLTVDEAITLYELSRALPHEAPVAVEIGSWQGKSSVCLASGLQGKRQPRLCCIDPFDASGDGESSPTYGERAQRVDGELRRAFEQNLRDAGLHELIDVRQGFSHQQAQHWQGSIDLLFLDGDHSYPSVRQDFEDWAPKVRPGGYLVMHDVVHPVHEGPARVVDELVRRDPTWVEARTVDSMFVARKAMV